MFNLKPAIIIQVLICTFNGDNSNTLTLKGSFVSCFVADFIFISQPLSMGSDRAEVCIYSIQLVSQQSWPVKNVDCPARIFLFPSGDVAFPISVMLARLSKARRHLFIAALCSGLQHLLHLTPVDGCETKMCYWAKKRKKGER